MFFEDESHNNNKDYYEGENYGALIVTVFVLFLLYLGLISFPLTILCFSSKQNHHPLFMIFIIICFFFCNGFLQFPFIFTINSDSKIIGILLEILNFFFMITSVSYQIIVKKNLFSLKIK